MFFFGLLLCFFFFFFFSSRRRHTRSLRDWSSDVCSSDLAPARPGRHARPARAADARVPPVEGEAPAEPEQVRSEERREGKSVDLGGRRIIKKKKKKKTKKHKNHKNKQREEKPHDTDKYK